MARFDGVNFVLTGTLSSMTRDAAADEIKKRGGKVTSSVSKKTGIVVAGTEAGIKTDKSRVVGCKGYRRRRIPCDAEWKRIIR